MAALSNPHSECRTPYSSRRQWLSVQDKVHVHDLHATILHQLGLNHEQLTFRHAGRNYRLTDVHGRVVKDVLA